MFEHIEILTLRAVFAAEGKGTLPPYLGSTLRGLLGHCIRSFVCHYPGLRCHLCTVSAGCAYAQNFSTPGHEAGAVNPFVLRSLTRDKEHWNSFDLCEFEITLIGDSARQAGLFVDALLDMEKRGWGAVRLPFRLVQITDPTRNTLIWNGGKTWLRNCQPQPLHCEKRRAGAALIHFNSPVRILVSRSLCKSLSFSDLIQSLIRRLSLLSQAYTGSLLHWNEEAMLAEARKIVTAEEKWRLVDFERYSMTQGGKLKLPAIEGWARYEGNLTPFTPILAAGEKLHAGKNATIGFGHYTVHYDQ